MHKALAIFYSCLGGMMNFMESDTKDNIKLIEYKKETNKDKTKSNNQFLRIAKIFEGINKPSEPKESMHLDLDSALQCLNLFMSFELQY